MANNLAYYILNDIAHDSFFEHYYQKLIKEYVGVLFHNSSVEFDNNYRRLLRYADILSLSDEELQQNLAQQIVILLSALFPLEDEILLFKQSVYQNVSNFVSANANVNSELCNIDGDMLPRRYAITIESTKYKSTLSNIFQPFLL